MPAEYDFLKNNPLLNGMSPEKLQFLMNFASSPKPTDIKEMMPFLLSATNSAKNKNIQFTQPETELLFQILKQNMSAEEAAKADKLIQLMKERRSGSLLLPIFFIMLPDRCHSYLQYLINRGRTRTISIRSFKVLGTCRFK